MSIEEQMQMSTDEQIALFTKVHNDFYSCYEYMTDIRRVKKKDLWEVLVKEEDGIYRGDCEDAALTIWNECVKRGMDKHKFHIIRCATERCPSNWKFDHAVLGFSTEEGVLISDNRYQDYPASPMSDFHEYSWFDAISYTSLTEGEMPSLVSTSGSLK